MTSQDTTLRTTGEIAEKLRLKPQTLKNWRHEGKGPSYVRVGRAIRYYESDVMAWLDQQRSQHIA